MPKSICCNDSYARSEGKSGFDFRIQKFRYKKITGLMAGLFYTSYRLIMQKVFCRNNENRASTARQGQYMKFFRRVQRLFLRDNYFNGAIPRICKK